MQKLKSHAEFEPQRIDAIRVDAPAKLADVVVRMLAKDPARRFQTASELADALAPFVDQHGAAKPSGDSGQVQFQKRNASPVRAGILSVGVLAAAILAAIGYVMTDNGTLVIESQDDKIQVVIRQGGREVEIVDTETGSKVVKLPTGEYQLALKGDRNSFTLNKDEFTLKRGASIVVRVRRKIQPPDMLAKPSTIPANSIKGYSLGPVKQGSAVHIQYVSGTWKGWGRLPDENQQPREGRSPK